MVSLGEVLIIHLSSYGVDNYSVKMPPGLDGRRMSCGAEGKENVDSGQVEKVDATHM